MFPDTVLHSLYWCQFWMGKWFFMHLKQLLRWGLELHLEEVENRLYLQQNCLAFHPGWFNSLLISRVCEIWHFLPLEMPCLLAIQLNFFHQTFNFVFPWCIFLLNQVKLFTDTLDKTMVEPRRQCYSLPSVNLRKKAVGGILFVTVTSASILTGSNMKGSSSGRQGSSLMDATLEENNENKVLQTFIEVELGELTRRTYASPGSSPRWDTTFNMVLHGDTGNLKFHLYKSSPICVKYDFLTSSEIKVPKGNVQVLFWRPLILAWLIMSMLSLVNFKLRVASMKMSSCLIVVFYLSILTKWKFSVMC